MEQLSYPSLLKRIQSTFIDVIVVILAMFFVAFVLSKFTETPGWVRGLIFFVLWVAYEPVSTSLGGTIGNRMMGIAVRMEVNTAKTLNLPRAYIRFIFKSLFGALSFITLNFNPKRRAIHDLVSGSIVIEK